MVYTTKEKVKQLAAPELDLTDADQAARVDALIAAVSPFIDRYCKRPAGYFAAAATDPTTRRVRGNGRNYLQLGRYTGAAVITSPAVAASSYYADPSGWLRWNDTPNNDGDYFPDNGDDCGPRPIGYRGFFSEGLVFIISARWGFAATPPDIELAASIIVGDIWEKGNGVIGEVSPTGFVIDRAIPLTARSILDQWTRREFEIN